MQNHHILRENPRKPSINGIARLVHQRVFQHDIAQLEFGRASCEARWPVVVGFWSSNRTNPHHSNQTKGNKPPCIHLQNVCCIDTGELMLSVKRNSKHGLQEILYKKVVYSRGNLLLALVGHHHHHHSSNRYQSL